MRLTKGMIDAIIGALAEVLAGEGYQGAEDDENEKLLQNAERALGWCHEQLRKRAAKSKKD